MKTSIGGIRVFALAAKRILRAAGALAAADPAPRGTAQATFADGCSGAWRPLGKLSERDRHHFGRHGWQ